jgi:hypothetical protein
MPVTQETVTVSTETRAVGKHVLALLAEAKKLAADGKVAFDEVPEALAAIMKDLIPAVAAVSKAGAELKENRKAFLASVFLSVEEMADALFPAA